MTVPAEIFRPGARELLMEHGVIDGAPQLSNSNGHEAPVQPLKFKRFSEIEAREIKWLWQPLIPFNFFTLCDGLEGVGKTFLLQNVAANAATRGISTLWLSNEDSPELILKPRFINMDADCTRIHMLDDGFTFDLRGIAALRSAIELYDAKLIVIDPLFSFTGRTDINNQADVRKITDALSKTADAYDCAIIGVRHFSKAKGFGDARNAGAHSIGWRTGCRSNLMVGCDPDDKSKRGVCQTKINIGPESEVTVGYEITSEGEFRWLGEIDLTSERMCSFKAQPESKENPVDECKAFLRNYLADGRKDVAEVKTAVAANVMCSWATIKRAGQDLGIIKTNTGFGSSKVWYWELPLSGSLSGSNKVGESISQIEPLTGSPNHKATLNEINNLALVAHDTLSEPLSEPVSQSAAPQSGLPIGVCKRCPRRRPLHPDGVCVECRSETAQEAAA
jgi:DNA repair protein RadA/Sms